jgi:hypothetical protein
MSQLKIASFLLLFFALTNGVSLSAASAAGAVCSYAACQKICLGGAYTGSQCSRRCTAILQKRVASGQCRSFAP